MRLVDEHPDSAGPRFTYDGGFLEIMTLSREHEEPNRTLASLVETILVEWDVDFMPAGSQTFRSEALGKGFEPDTSYYIARAAEVRGRQRLSPSTDPPPDLVIEVEVTEPFLPRLPIFAALGVPEIWLCEGDAVRIFTLQGGDYRAADTSPALTPLSAERINSFLHERLSMKRPHWIRTVRAWARAQSRPAM
jgi:Uma2 family endonuclease